MLVCLYAGMLGCWYASGVDACGLIQKIIIHAPRRPVEASKDESMAREGERLSSKVRVLLVSE